MTATTTGGLLHAWYFSSPGPLVLEHRMRVHVDTGVVDGGMTVVVTGDDGVQVLSEVVLPLHRSGARACDPAEHTRNELLELARAVLLSTGWVTGSSWRVSDRGRQALTTDLQPLPRVGLSGQEERVLAVVSRVTQMTRGPVTASAVMPAVTGRHREAVALMQRLVAGGHLRVVGSTPGRHGARLYAVTGTRWAPETCES